MSKFKLDFDISTPARRLVPRAVARCPSESVGSAADAPRIISQDCESQPPDIVVGNRQHKSAPSHCGSDPAKQCTTSKSPQSKTTKQKKRKGTRIPVKYAVLFVVTVVGLFSLTLLPAPNPSLRSHSAQYACQQRSSPLPIVTCINHCGQNDRCVAKFETAECARRIHSVHFHYNDGRTRRVPALYQRVSNTTMFLVEGDRAVFQQADCKATMGGVVLQSEKEANRLLRLQSHVVWIAPSKSTRFRVTTDTGSVLAEIDGKVVKDMCSGSICVYKLEVRCQQSANMHVFALDQGKYDLRVESFLYC